ncbi:DUF6088 family protein [Flavivirga sp. 57AJ16]|uniref:DUF6088 family protein n=1 Tax=Flavivirga sp. 57AJ16 TaxID=3025307 RepID=UPI002366E07A|nr:DUF6088 family protein [Flavivirga sp. 57AJ16]MDD7887857.1 DUF6088 family protein [Flavivirga sp. 57AJ16]
MYICTMTVSKQIETIIQTIPEGQTFGYKKFAAINTSYTAIAKTLERLIKKKVIKKVSKGIFYKPEKTIFGELKPNQAEILKPYLFENGKRIAYITGIALYNQLGLTTQIPNEYKIASLTKRIYVNTINIKAKPVKSYIEVTDTNYNLLGLLDALKDFNSIPDIDSAEAVKRLSYLFQELDKTQLKKINQYALKYPPRVRAFLGALLDSLNKDTGNLKDSLNPLTTYDLNIKEGVLPSKKNWNII